MLYQEQHVHTTALRAMDANLQKELPLCSIESDMYMTYNRFSNRKVWQNGPTTYLAHTMLLIRM